MSCLVGGVNLEPRTEEPAEGSGVVADPDGAELRQGNRAGMPVTIERTRLRESGTISRLPACCWTAFPPTNWPAFLPRSTDHRPAPHRRGHRRPAALTTAVAMLTARGLVSPGRMAIEQAELRRFAGRLGAGATAELGQDVADVHVDRARAEEQLPGDLAVGAPDRDKAQHLELTPRQAGVLQLPRGPSAESTLDPRRGGRAPQRRRLGRAPSRRAAR